MLFVVFLTWILPSAIIHKIEDSQQTAVKRRPTVSPDDQNSPLRTHLRDLNPEENFHAAAAAAKLLPLWPTLCNPRDGSPPGSAVPGILQARTLKWVAISFSNACKWKVKVKSLSCVQLLATPWTAAYQAPLSMGFSRQEYWSGVPLASPKVP